MPRKKKAPITPIRPPASPDTPDALAPGSGTQITLDLLAEWIKTDGRKRVIVSMNEAGDGIDFEKCAWVGMPITMALSVICDFLPGFRALEQSAVYGIVPPNAQEAAPQPPGGANGTQERKDA